METPQNIHQARRTLKSYIKEDDRWAIVLKENGKVIGQLRLYPDENRGQYSARNSAKLVNYPLSEAYWGRGYMTEAVKRVVKYVFDEMHVELLGYDGQVFDSVCHSILKTEYYGECN